MLELNEDNFEKEVLKSDKSTIVKFTASWCGPCRAMAPIYEELSKEMKDIKFTELDVDKNQELASQYNVMSIPTLIVFKKGKEILRQIGGMPKEALKEKLKSVV